MIKWRLAVIMADREVDYRWLAKETGLHPVTVNRLKNTYAAPPRISVDTLDKFCAALGCQPGDLMKFYKVEGNEVFCEEEN